MRKKELLSFLIAFSIGSLAVAATIDSIDFKVANNQSILEISSDEPLNYNVSERPDESQFHLSFDGADLGPSASRRLDTSSFNSPVSLISPYQISETGEAKVVVQLREGARARASQNGNMVRVDFVRTSQAQAATGEETGDDFDLDEDLAEDAEDFAEDSGTGGEESEEVAATQSTGSSGSSDFQATTIETSLDSFVKNRTSRRFIGSPVTIKVKNAEVKDVLNLIAEASGFNMITTDVQGTITVSLEDVPWDQALDVVLQTLQLGAERNGNILRVLPLASLTAEKQAEQKARAAAKQSAPKVTRVFPISYANIDEMVGILREFGKSSSQETNATVATDARTNSIIVQDIADNIERVTKIIEILDTQTPQILVEAKIIEATEFFSKTIGGNLGIGSLDSGFGAYGATFNGGEPLDALVASATFGGENSGGGGEFGFTPTLGFLPNDMRINAFLSLKETENEIRVVSSPKTVVLNRRAATITQSTPVAVPVTQIDAAGVSNTTFQFIDAVLSLSATPTVTNDEGVLMELQIQRGIPFAAGNGQTGVANRQMNTQVLVQNGSTLVIGGIYTSDVTRQNSGFPFLKDIPIIGSLFSEKSNESNRVELFIFVTPRILNTRAAGLT